MRRLFTPPAEQRVARKAGHLLLETVEWDAIDHHGRGIRDTYTDALADAKRRHVARAAQCCLYAESHREHMRRLPDLWQ